MSEVGLKENGKYSGGSVEILNSLIVQLQNCKTCIISARLKWCFLTLDRLSYAQVDTYLTLSYLLFFH